MLKKWLEAKGLLLFRNLAGVKEGEWFELNGEEFMIANGDVFSRPCCTDMVTVGVMIGEASNDSILRNTFRPAEKSIYYYWAVDANTGEWELKCAVYIDSDRDKRNIAMNNCFATAVNAETYKKELEKIFK